MFAVTVTFRIKPESRDAFRRAILQNAMESKRSEDGCHQFDVCSDPERPDEIFLYELYRDSAAFDTHLQSDHFIGFSKEVEEMVVDKTVKTYGSVA